MGAEHDLTKAIRDLLCVMRIEHFKHWGGPLSEKGIPDIIGCYGGRFLAIEIKAPKGVVSPQQQEFLDRYTRAGGIAFVARSIEDVIKALGLEKRVLL